MDGKYQLKNERVEGKTSGIPIIRIKLKSGQIIRCREDFAEEMIRKRQAVRIEVKGGEL
jgi:major membrane immunogen (membrane-anchored lipoprotein)